MKRINNFVKQYLTLENLSVFAIAISTFVQCAAFYKTSDAYKWLYNPSFLMLFAFSLSILIFVINIVRCIYKKEKDYPLFAFTILVIATLFFTQNINILWTLVLIGNAKDIDYKKIFKAVSVALTAFFILDIIGLLTKTLIPAEHTRNGIPRNDLGLTHPNCAGVALFTWTYTTYIGFLKDINKKTIMVFIAVFLFTALCIDSRTPEILEIIFFIITIIGNVLEHKKISMSNFFAKTRKYIFILLPIVCMIFTFSLTLFLSKYPILNGDGASARFAWPIEAIKQHGISFVDPKISYGKGTNEVITDNMYLYLLIFLGGGNLILIVSLMCLYNYKLTKIENTSLYILSICIALYTFMERYFCFCFLNPLLLLTLYNTKKTEKTIVEIQ